MNDIAPGSHHGASRKTVWPITTQCSRIEQRLLIGLRSLDPRSDNRKQALHMLQSIGLDTDGVSAFSRLRPLLELNQPPVRLLGPGASFVGLDELDLLACLNRLSRSHSRDAHLTTESVAGGNALLVALYDCAAAMQRAGLPLRQRTLPHTGRRFLEREGITERQASSRTLHRVTVLRVAALTPHMRRITIGGADMPGYLQDRPGQWVKLFAPQATAEGTRAGRAYTIRHYRPALREFDIDCVLHDSGPMSRWAATAEPGQQLEVSGVRGGFPIDGGLAWLMLAGDQAAVPAIATILEAMPAEMTAKVILEVQDAAEMAAVPALATAEVQFVARQRGRRTSPGSLLDLIRDTALPQGPGRIWLAAEASVTRALRNHFLVDRMVPAKQIHSVAYWKRGEQDHTDMAAG